MKTIKKIFILMLFVPFAACADVVSKTCMRDAECYYALAKSAYDIDKKIDQSIIINLENSAKFGSDKAEYKLGVIYSDKDLGYYDYIKAKYFLTRQANKNNYDAAYLLAQMIYQKGGLGKSEYNDIEKYLKIAVKNSNNIDAYRDLSMIYFYAPDKFMDFGKAYKYSLEASQNEIPEAQYILGTFYDFGVKPVSKNYEKAFYWYDLAAKQGYASAINNLGVLYAKGKGILKDEKKAINLFEQAYKLGDTKAMLNLGDAYLKGILGVTQDVPKAKKYFNEALLKGDEDANEYLKRIVD